MPDSGRSAPKCIVVTGATKGLGRALVDRFVEAGARVAGCGRSLEEIRELAAAYGPSHWFEPCDVANPKSVDGFAQRTLEKFGAPDLLINNAAVINRSMPLWRINDDEFGRLIDINVKGVFHVSRRFLPAMIERGIGTVVNLSSGWGRTTAPEVAPYCASKWAIEGLTQSLAQELPAGLAAVALNPGIIDTQMLRSCFGGSAENYPGPVEWSRRAAPFLLSLTAAHNGRSLDVPG